MNIHSGQLSQRLFRLPLLLVVPPFWRPAIGAAAQERSRCTGVPRPKLSRFQQLGTIKRLKNRTCRPATAAEYHPVFLLKYLLALCQIDREKGCIRKKSGIPGLTNQAEIPLFLLLAAIQPWTSTVKPFFGFCFKSPQTRMNTRTKG